MSRTFRSGETEGTSKVARMGCRIYEVGIGWKDGVRAFRCILKYR